MTDDMSTMDAGMGAQPAPAASGARQDAQSDARQDLWIALVSFLIVLLFVVPFLWVAGPAWYIRLTGTEAQGRAFTEDTDANSVITWVVYQDAQGQLHDIPPECCSNDFYQDGQLPVWYLPNDPTSTLIGGGNALLLYILTGIGLLFLLPFGGSFLIGFLSELRQLIAACVQMEDFARLWWLVLGCLLILSTVLLALHLWPPSGAHPAIGPARNFQAGETVSIDGRWAVTVQGAQAIGSRSPDAAGTICLELDLTLRNTTHQPLVLNLNQFTLYDTQEQQLSASCSIDAFRLANAKLAPGQTIKGALAFRVLASLRQCYLAFRPDPATASSIGRSFWRLPIPSSKG